MDEDKDKFITEKIIKKDKSRYINLMKLLLSAVVFGVVAMATALFTRPGLEKFIVKSTTEKETISIEKDTTVFQNSTEVIGTEDTEAFKNIAESIIDEHSYDEEDVKAMYKVLANLTNDLDSCVTAIHSIKNEKDWFDNLIESGHYYSGLVIAKTENEVLVLCPVQAIDAADTINVSFKNNYSKQATVKSADGHIGLAILSVDTSDADNGIKEGIEVIALGNSYLVSRGDIALAIGSPTGFNYSTGYGWVSYISKDVSIVDSSAMFMHTSLALDNAKGSFLVNTSRELIGIATSAYQSESSTGVAIGISDLKARLEYMINAMPAAYIGIKPIDINAKAKESGVPEGIYVTEVVADSPAYISGIQVGDVISEIDGIKVSSTAAYKEVIDKLTVGKEINIKLYRDNGKNEYSQLDINLTVASR
jgi:hypothetical protein